MPYILKGWPVFEKSYDPKDIEAPGPRRTRAVAPNSAYCSEILASRDSAPGASWCKREVAAYQDEGAGATRPLGKYCAAESGDPNRVYPSLT